MATPAVESLKVDWTAVTNADGYKVQWRLSTETDADYDTTRQRDGERRLSATIPSPPTLLDHTLTYTVRVTATREHANDGPPSVGASARPKAPAPAKVGTVTLTVGIRKLDVSWPQATNADGYLVQWKSGSEAYADTRQNTIASGTTLTDEITGLTPGTSYTVQVIATRTNADPGEASDEQSATPKAESPAKVAGLVVTPQVRSLDLEWNEAPTSDGEKADGYVVQWRLSTETDTDYGTGNRQHTLTGLSYTIPTLDPDKTYAVRVRGTRTHADPGDWSDSVTGRPMTDPPAKVTGLALTQEVRQLVVNWSQATNADGYKVQWKSGSEDYNTGDRQHEISSGATLTDTITGLTPGTDYTVRVLATRDNAPDGEASDEETEWPKIERPGAVTNVSATPQVEELAVAWDEATNAGGYKVQWKSGDQEYNTGDRQEEIDGGTTLTYTIPNLDHMTTYTVRVLATRQYADDGDADETTARPRAPAPAQVTGVTVTPLVRQLTVTWSPATNADGYRLQWRLSTETDTDYDTTRQAVFDSSTRSHTIPSLDDGERPGEDPDRVDVIYTVRVISTRDNADDGDPSTGVNGQPKTDPRDRRRAWSRTRRTPASILSGGRRRMRTPTGWSGRRQAAATAAASRIR